ncbi:MAG: hypothetical protein H6606_07375 [Flavobacteriales bacterium]|nr:hypothetical protein [Flavobacteriales bacterium]
MFPDLDQYIDNPSPENTRKLFDALDNQQFNIHDLSISSRVFTHWKQHELIPFLDESRVQLNVFQLIWVMLIEDLRHMGIPIAKIKQIRDQLFKPMEVNRETLFDKDGRVKPEFLSFPSMTGEDPKDVATELERLLEEEPELFESFFEHIYIPPFVIILVNILYRNQDHTLFVDSSGEIFLSSDNVKSESELPEKPFQELINEHRNEPMLILPLRKYLYKLTTTARFEDRIADMQILNPVEREVISMMREGNLKELRIILDPNDKHTDLVYTQTKSIEQKDMQEVIDRFKERKHVGLVLKSNDGKTVQYEYQNRKRFVHSND